MDDWDYTFDDGWFEVIRFFDLPYIYAILGHISVSIEIYRSSWSHMIFTTHKMHVELIVYCYLIMIPQWSLSWAIQSGPHFSAFRCRHTSPSEVRLSDLWVWFNYGCGWLGLHIRWWMTWGHLIFPTYHTSDSILGHISYSVKICRSPLIGMNIPSYEMHVGLMIWLHFALILRWSLYWVIRSGPYFLMLSWFLDVDISDA